MSIPVVQTTFFLREIDDERIVILFVPKTPGFLCSLFARLSFYPTIGHSIVHVLEVLFDEVFQWHRLPACLFNLFVLRERLDEATRPFSSNNPSWAKKKTIAVLTLCFITNDAFFYA
jgi:hypothetical protein